MAVVIPREIERVEEKQATIEAELKAMQSLLKIVGEDMVAGISDDGVPSLSPNLEAPGTKVWGMLIDFKQTVAMEEQIIKRDIRALEKQMSQLSESLGLLRNLKRKVEATKRMMKVAREGKEEAEGQKEAKEDARRLRNDFKHYIRTMWLFKNGQDVNESYDAGSIDADRDRLGSFYPMVSRAFKGGSRPASALMKSQQKNRSIIAGGGVSSPMSTSGGAIWS